MEGTPSKTGVALLILLVVLSVIALVPEQFADLVLGR